MEIIDFIMKIDEHLASIINIFGPWTYIILFAIIFAETGLVVTPFLPGDSLLFAVGALAGGGMINVWTAYLAMLAAAILGDTVNYWIGHHIGPRVFYKDKSRIFNKAYLEKTREFFAKYGGKTIILARFMPIIRTFAPFVAGMGKMHYSTFLLYNAVGGFVWVTALTFGGYLFGGLPFVKHNFELVIIGIIIISLVPMVVEYLRHRFATPKTIQPLEKITYEDIQETFKQEKLND